MPEIIGTNWYTNAHMHTPPGNITTPHTTISNLPGNEHFVALLPQKRSISNPVRNALVLEEPRCTLQQFLEARRRLFPVNARVRGANSEAVLGRHSHGEEQSRAENKPGRYHQRQVGNRTTFTKRGRFSFLVAGAEGCGHVEGQPRKMQ